MMTVRQIERHWESKAFERLFVELIAARPEASLRLGIDTAQRVPAAALAVVRLNELTQSHAKLYPKLLRAILASQEADGGWGDLVTTALSLRALLCGQGYGPGVDRGMKSIADLQKSEGIWPGIPIRRMPADPYLSALVLYLLAEHQQFRRSVRLGDAVAWFTAQEPRLDQPALELWRRAKKRCGVPTDHAVLNFS